MPHLLPEQPMNDCNQELQSLSHPDFLCCLFSPFYLDSRPTVTSDHLRHDTSSSADDIFGSSGISSSSLDRPAKMDRTCSIVSSRDMSSSFGSACGEHHESTHRAIPSMVCQRNKNSAKGSDAMVVDELNPCEWEAFPMLVS